MTDQSSNYKSSDKWAESRITSRQDSLGCQSSSINSSNTALLLRIDPL